MGLGSIFLSCELNKTKQKITSEELHEHLMIYEICLMNLLLTDWLFIWIPTVIEATVDYTGNTSSCMKTQYSANDKPWDLDQVSDLSTLI